MRSRRRASLAQLKAMLRREEAERHSDAVQAAFGVAEAAGSETDWLEVVSAMQARVVVEAGVPSERRAAALWLLRSAASLARR